MRTDWRSNVSRRLYDHGVAVQGSPRSRQPRGPLDGVFCHHADLDRLGLVTGDVVNITGSNDNLSLGPSR